MKIKFIVLSLLLLSSLYRISLTNHPFWIDEFSSAIQARLLSEYGLFGFFNQKEYYAEPNNITTHALIAISFALLGESESAARLPLMIAGSFVPPLLFLLGRRIFSSATGLVAGLLGATSYFMITWSRQARGYVLQQLLLLLLLWLYYKFLHEKKPWTLLMMALVAVFGVLTHYFFGVFVALVGIDLLWRYRAKIHKYWIAAISFIAILGIVGQLFSLLPNLLATVSGILNQGPSNNLWYYHALLWREETVLTFCAFLGIIVALFVKRDMVRLPLLLLATQLFVITFVIPAYTSRYLAPVFPLLILFAGYAIVQIAQRIAYEITFKSLSGALAVLIAVFIIGNGHMFTLTPQAYYSVDHVMRDIAIVDYHQVYNRIREARVVNPSVAVIETWADRAHWYLGQSNASIYWFRWLSQEGTINGLPLKTNAVQQSDGTKHIPLTGPQPLRLISSVSDLEQVMKEHVQGFIWIDDTSMPADVIAYAEENFQREVQLSHYSFDDNPYSIWPGTLYSWGITAQSEKAENTL